MPTELLTAHKVRSYKTPGVYVDGRGLRLIVTAKIKKRWELWISINRKKRQLGLGVFPHVSIDRIVRLCVLCQNVTSSTRNSHL